MSRRFEGKIAFVTGRSRGIGAAIVKRLAEDGAKVAFTYVKNRNCAEAIVQSIKNKGDEAIAICADNENPQAIEAAILSVSQSWKKIDILVNSAGIYHVAPIEQCSIADFDKSIAVNVRAAFVAIKAVLPLMPDGGHIISIGTIGAVRMPFPNRSLYAASKAALTGLTQALARELGPRRITVNIIHPGSTDTDMNPASSPLAAVVKPQLAIPCYIEPNEIADVVAFLASDSGRSITGSAWIIDNGAIT